MATVEIETGNIIKRFEFWNPKTWSIPKLYWDAWSQEQRLHAICRQLEKVIAYSDYIGVNVDDIASRLKAIENGELDEFIVQKIIEWFNENQPAIMQALEDMQIEIDELQSHETYDSPFEVTTGRDNNSNSVYTIVKFPKNAVEMGVKYRYTDYPNKTVGEYVKTLENVSFAINGPLRGVFVQNGIGINLESEDTNQYWYFLGFDRDGNFMYTPDIQRTLTAVDLIDAGFYQAFGIWSPICINSVQFDTSILPSHEQDPTTNLDGLYNFVHTRSIFGADLVGNYYFATIEGRLTSSFGMTFDQMYEFCIVHGITTAFNLDGGGSTQLWTCGETNMNFVFPDSSGTARFQDSRHVVGLITASRKVD